MIPWLRHETDFPPVAHALREPNGLLAAGGELAPSWLLAAYSRGVFPWYSEGEPVLWWSPDPRLVLMPGSIRIRRSLRKVLRGGRFTIRFDTAFAQVIEACARPRPGQHGTWIIPEMQVAYRRLHELGHAHCVEAWLEGKLVGGLYGVSIGRAFFGESMFSLVPDASKCCLAWLARFLDARDYGVIDCQMTTAHLLSMGAQEIPRAEFVATLGELTRQGEPPGQWPAQPTGIAF